MKSFSLFFFILCIASCGPRDDEKLRDQGGNGGNPGFALAADQVLTASAPGQKLESCSQPDQPTWDTLRLYKETSFLFDKVDQLKVIVGRGDFNCAPVKSGPLQIEVQDGMAWRKTGVFYVVDKIEMHNLEDFLRKTDLVQKIARDMAMTEDQLRSFLTAGNARPQITITYLQGSDTEVVPPSLPVVKELSFLETEGQTISECGETIWTDIRLVPEIQGKVQSALDERTLKAVINTGDRNCLKVGSEISIMVKAEGWKPVPGVRVKVVGVMVMDKSLLQIFPSLAEAFSEEMGLSFEDFNNYVQSFDGEAVNVTRLQWLE